MWPFLQRGHKSKGNFGISAALEGKLLGADFHSYSTGQEESSRRKILFGKIKCFSFLGKHSWRWERGNYRKAKYILLTDFEDCGWVFIWNITQFMPCFIHYKQKFQHSIFYNFLDRSGLSFWAESSAEPSDELNVSNWISFQVNLKIRLTLHVQTYICWFILQIWNKFQLQNKLSSFFELNFPLISI